MGKTKDLIPLKELNLTNRFLFDEVLEDPQTFSVLSLEGIFLCWNKMRRKKS